MLSCKHAGIIRRIFTLMAGLAASAIFSAHSLAEQYHGNCTSVTGSAHPASPPFSWQDRDKVIGALPDFAALIFKEVGLEYESKFSGPWKRIIANIEAGRLDAAITSAYREFDKERITLIETPMTRQMIVVYVRRGEEFPFRHLGELKDRLGLIPTDLKNSVDLMGRIPNGAILEESRQLDIAFRMLEINRVSYIISPLLSGETTLRQMDLQRDIVYFQSPISQIGEHLAISMRITDCGITPDQLEAAIASLHAKSVFPKLIRKNISLWEETRL